MILIIIIKIGGLSQVDLICQPCLTMLLYHKAQASTFRKIAEPIYRSRVNEFGNQLFAHLKIFCVTHWLGKNGCLNFSEMLI